MMNQFVVVRNQQDGGSVLIEARDEIHQLLEVTPILPKRGFIENDQRRAQGKAGGESGTLLLTDGEREGTALTQVEQVGVGEGFFVQGGVKTLVIMRTESDLFLH